MSEKQKVFLSPHCDSPESVSQSSRNEDRHCLAKRISCLYSFPKLLPHVEIIVNNLSRNFR